MAADVIFKSILYGNCCILIQISLKYVSKVGAEIWRQVIIWTNDGIDYWCLYVRMYICTQRRWVNSCCFSLIHVYDANFAVKGYGQGPPQG